RVDRADVGVRSVGDETRAVVFGLDEFLAHLCACFLRERVRECARGDECDCSGGEQNKLLHFQLLRGGGGVCAAFMSVNHACGPDIPAPCAISWINDIDLRPRRLYEGFMRPIGEGIDTHAISCEWAVTRPSSERGINAR